MLTKFAEYVQKEKLNVDSVILTKDGMRFEHYFEKDKRNNIRSISKVVSCLGAYKAIENSLYTLDTHILQFFDMSKITNKNNLPYLEHMKIHNLLNLTIGQDKGLMFSKDIKLLPSNTDYLYYILNYDIHHEPGTSFIYNNAATYLLCAITQSITGEYFADWLQKKLFDYMDIELGEWESSSQGICLGASGLHITNKDMHKIALLLLNEGMYNDKKLISSDWIKLMRTPQFMTYCLPEYKNKQSRCINKMAYGYGLWICGDGSLEHPRTHYFCDGTDGQFLIVSPRDNSAMTVMSHQKDMNPLYIAFSYYFS